MTEESPPRAAPVPWSWRKTTLLLIVVAIVAVAYGTYGDVLTLETLAKYEEQLREVQRQQPLVVVGLAFALYVIVTGLSLPGAAVLTLSFGWYFGIAWGVPIVSFASTAGATVAFLLSRYLFRDAVRRRFGERLESFNQALEREGPFFLFALRLVPAVPFFVINAVMGLTPMRTWTFWWVSQLGMLAGTVVYVYAGASVPSLMELDDKGARAVFTFWQLAQIFGAFGLLAVFPFLVRGAVAHWKRRPQGVRSSQP